MLNSYSLHECIRITNLCFDAGTMLNASKNTAESGILTKLFLALVYENET